jgi:hypothetical protein
METSSFKNFDLKPLDRARADALLQRLSPGKTELNDWNVRQLKKGVGLTNVQFDKTVNLLVEAGLATVEASCGGVYVSLTDEGRRSREMLWGK